MSWLTFSGKKIEYIFNALSGGCQARFISPVSYIYISVTMTALLISTVAVIGAMQCHWQNSVADAETSIDTVMVSTGLVSALLVSIALSAISRMMLILVAMASISVPLQSKVVLFFLSLACSVVNPYVLISMRQDLQDSLKILFYFVLSCSSQDHQNEQETCHSTMPTDMEDIPQYSEAEERYNVEAEVTNDSSDKIKPFESHLYKS